MRIICDLKGINDAENDARSKAETESDSSAASAPDFETVWVDYLETPAKISSEDATNCIVRLSFAPWTREEFPIAARWLDENAVVFAVYEKALDAPKFGRPHFPGDEPAAGWLATLLPDVQALRGVARTLAIRANYRIGRATSTARFPTGG